MEEKTKKTKVQALKQTPEKQEKLTYEQLEQLAGNLNQQCQELYTQLQRTRNMISGLQVVEILLAVLKQGENFSDSFVALCSSKVEEIITATLSPSSKDASDTDTEKLN